MQIFHQNELLFFNTINIKMANTEFCHGNGDGDGVVQKVFETESSLYKKKKTRK